MNKKLKLTLIILGCLGILFSGLSFGVHQFAGQKIVEEMPKQINRVLPPYIRLTYTDLTAENCVFALCLSAKNVLVSVPSGMDGESVSFSLGTIRASRNIAGFYRLTADKEENTIAMPAEVINVSLEADGTLQEIFVRHLSAQQGNFRGDLAGEINRDEKRIDLKGEAVGLAQFIGQFIPPDLKFITDFIFQNALQKISVSSDGEQIYFLDVPIMSAKFLFH